MSRWVPTSSRLQTGAGTSRLVQVPGASGGAVWRLEASCGLAVSWWPEGWEGDWVTVCMTVWGDKLDKEDRLGMGDPV